MPDDLVESIVAILPFAGVLVFVGVILAAAHWLLLARRKDLGNERKLPRQLIMLGLTIAGLVLAISALPVSDELQNRLLGLVGILISGIFAFSSTTIVANLMAGVILRMTKPFRIGDFIRVRDHFGRVTERGLFDTEIQTETRDLIALPNTYFVTNPVTTIRSSGTIISTSLSLGYDVDHSRVETLLTEAAKKNGLEEPFVHILELGNFAVTYRVSGFLAESKNLISARSKLCASVLDTLHGEGVEIMSPAFMNQRRLDPGAKAIPSTLTLEGVGTPAGAVEDIAFDKAERAEGLEKERLDLVEEVERLEAANKESKDDEEKKRNSEAIERHRARLADLERTIGGAKSGEEETGGKDRGANA